MMNRELVDIARGEAAMMSRADVVYNCVMGTLTASQAVDECGRTRVTVQRWVRDFRRTLLMLPHHDATPYRLTPEQIQAEEQRIASGAPAFTAPIPVYETRGSVLPWVGMGVAIATLSGRHTLPPELIAAWVREAVTAWDNGETVVDTSVASAPVAVPPPVAPLAPIPLDVQIARLTEKIDGVIDRLDALEERLDRVKDRVADLNQIERDLESLRGDVRDLERAR